jgi:glucose-fructose oxidoreductase
MGISRRSFIKQSSALLGAASLGCIGLFDKDDKPQQVKPKLGVALLGLGSYSTYQLAPALQLTQYCELKGVITGSPYKIPQWKSEYGIEDRNVYTYDTIEDIEANEDIDIVYIVTPTSTHADFAIRAANAGKHVFCEKPMAMTVEECQAIIDACNNNEVFLSVGYRMQHEQNTRLVMSYARNERYGQVQRVDARAGYYSVPNDQDYWRQKADMGGGALYDMGVYPINAIRYASGKEPIQVRGNLMKMRPELFPDVDETTSFDMRFADGSIARGRTSVGENMNILEATCENGWYKLEPFQAYTGVQGSTSDGVQLQAMSRNQQALQMDNDALAIKNGDDPLVPGEEGMRDIQIVNAIIESSSNGGTWVDIPI